MTDDQTRPHEAGGDTHPNRRTRPTETRPGRRRKRAANRPTWLVLAALGAAALLILFGAAGTGYLAGSNEREQIVATEAVLLLQEQFDLGVEDLEAGRLQTARQRFEYILEQQPDYPGANDLLTLVLQGLNEPTSTPSPTATEIVFTPTATISLQSLDGLLEAARGANQRDAWDEAIELLLSLRRRDPSYRLDEVNAELFTAFRNRGLSLIFSRDLERGIFDLSVAARVGTLDSQASSWMRSAAFYQFANSFIELEWSEATRNFADLCAAGIWDSCFKYAKSAKEYGNLLVQDEQYCDASFQYEQSLNTVGDRQLEPTATHVFELCLTATATPPTPTPTGTLTTLTPGTPTATVPGASATPTATATSSGASATPTATSGPPSATPTATLSPTPTETPTP